MDDYELIDAGEGGRLERFGDILVDRPQAGAFRPRAAPARWVDADLRFDRDRGWTGPGLDMARAGWTVRIAGVAMVLRPTEAGQVGVFAEHAERLGWLRRQVEERSADADAPVEVLNLFAYTGLATVGLAAVGAAVTHVDAARPTVAWARQNAGANGLAAAPIRWIVDDAARFTEREQRRGRQYDGIVLDPPSYGHGGRRSTWQLARDLPGLLTTCAALLRRDGFLLLTAHTEGVDADDLEAQLAGTVAHGRGGRRARGPLDLVATSGVRLALGAFATWEGGA